MTDKKLFIAMLDDARIDYGFTEGDCVIINDCKFRFASNGKLMEIINI